MLQIILINCSVTTLKIYYNHIFIKNDSYTALSLTMPLSKFPVHHYWPINYNPNASILLILIYSALTLRFNQT